MIEILDKFVKKLIIPQYPWIDDAIWVPKTYKRNLYFEVENKKWWALEVYVNRKKFAGADKYALDKLQEDVKSLYNVVGLPENEIFAGIDVHYND